MDRNAMRIGMWVDGDGNKIQIAMGWECNADRIADGNEMEMGM